jgi:ribosome-associated toxin RatA of RatAB toxin-antitoxin module
MRYLLLSILILVLSVSESYSVADENICSEPVITYEKGADGKKIIKALFMINADPELVYHTLRDVTKFPEFMPGAAGVKMVEDHDDYQIVKFSGERGLLSADIVMKRTIIDKKRRVEWSLVEGPPREVKGYWHVEKDTKNELVSIVHYTNYVDAGAIIPDFLVRKYLREDIEKMVPNIVKRVASGGTWISDDYLKKKGASSVTPRH